MKKKVEKLNRVRNLVVHPIFYLGYVITISLKCQMSPQPPPPLMGCQAIWRGVGQRDS